MLGVVGGLWGGWGGWWGPAGPPAHSIMLSASQSGSVCAPSPPATLVLAKTIRSARGDGARGYHRRGDAGGFAGGEGGALNK